MKHNPETQAGLSVLKVRFEFSDIRFGETFSSPPAFDDIESASRIVTVNDKGGAHVINLYGDKFKLNVEVGKNKSVQLIALIQLIELFGLLVLK